MRFKPANLLALLLPVTGLLFHTGTQAAPSDAQWQALNIQLSEHHVLPRYQQLEKASRGLESATAQLCKQPGSAALDASQQAFHQTMDAWQGIQHVQFGPVEFLMRNFSLQFWPDKKNLTSKQLGELLAAEDGANLNEEYFRGASVAVKGLPGLERLLFGEEPLSPYGCQLTHAIARHVHTMSGEIASEWQQQQLPRILAAPAGDDYYEDSVEAATELMKALVEPVEVIRDLKLLRPLHKSAQQAKPRRSESWRSNRSLRNVQLNLAALAELYRGDTSSSVKQLLAAEGETELAGSIDTLFTTIDSELTAIKLPLAEAVSNPVAHQQLRTITAQLKELHSQLELAMQKLEITLGFNSRDGD